MDISVLKVLLDCGKHTTSSQVYCKSAVYMWKGGDHGSLSGQFPHWHCEHKIPP